MSRLVTAARCQIRRHRDEVAQAEIAALYELVRRMYGRGEPPTDVALREVADALGLAAGLAADFGRKAKQDGRTLADAPTGSDLLYEVRAECSARAERIEQASAPATRGEAQVYIHDGRKRLAGD